MQKHTKTKDEQDAEHPYKPFPMRAYFADIAAAWKAEPVLLIEKSRTLMATWFCAALCLHAEMTVPATTAIFMAQDEERSLIPLDYCWTLWEQQDEYLKQLWPIDRPRDKQAYNIMEFKNGSRGVALPGKNPDKIRGYHPTIVFFDEAADHEKFGEALDVALATRVPKMVAISSVKPSDFCELTRPAQEVEWPYA